MLKEIVHAILPINFARTFRYKKEPYANRDNIRKRQEGKLTKQTQDAFGKYNKIMDDAQTHEIKNKSLKNLEVPVLLSFLIFYVCFINVIIKCDVSVNDVNIKKYKEQVPYRTHSYFKDKPRMWHGHKHDESVHGKNLRSSHMSAKRETEDDKTDKYAVPEVQEFSKYYYKSKVDLASNVTEYPEYYKIPKYVLDDSRAVGFPHDLASNPYYVKKTNFHLRPEKHKFHKKIVKLGVLLPADPEQVFSLVKVLPILEIAIPRVTKPDGPLPGWTILVDYRDTMCSSIDGPLAAFEFYVNGSAGKLLQHFKSLLRVTNQLANIS